MIFNFQQANLDNRLVFSQLPLLLQDGQSGMLPHTVQKVWLVRMQEIPQLNGSIWIFFTYVFHPHCSKISDQKVNNNKIRLGPAEKTRGKNFVFLQLDQIWFFFLVNLLFSIFLSHRGEKLMQKRSRWGHLAKKLVFKTGCNSDFSCKFYITRHTKIFCARLSHSCGKD